MVIPKIKIDFRYYNFSGTAFNLGIKMTNRPEEGNGYLYIYSETINYHVHISTTLGIFQKPIKVENTVKSRKSENILPKIKI